MKRNTRVGLIASGGDIVRSSEIPYDFNKILSGIENRRKHGRSFTIIAVAEGAESVTDAVLLEEERRRVKETSHHATISYRLASELEAAAGRESRVAVPGRYQRGGPPCPFDRVLTTQFGTYAAHLAQRRKYRRMVRVQRGEIVAVPLEDAARCPKFLPMAHPLLQTARDIGMAFGD